MSRKGGDSSSVGSRSSNASARRKVLHMLKPDFPGLARARESDKLTCVLDGLCVAFGVSGKLFLTDKKAAEINDLIKTVRVTGSIQMKRGENGNSPHNEVYRDAWENMDAMIEEQCKVTTEDAIRAVCRETFKRLRAVFEELTISADLNDSKFAVRHSRVHQFAGLLKSAHRAVKRTEVQWETVIGLVSEMMDEVRKSDTQLFIVRGLSQERRKDIIYETRNRLMRVQYMLSVMYVGEDDDGAYPVVQDNVLYMLNALRVVLFGDEGVTFGDDGISNFGDDGEDGEFNKSEAGSGSRSVTGSGQQRQRRLGALARIAGGEGDDTVSMAQRGGAHEIKIDSVDKLIIQIENVKKENDRLANGVSEYTRRAKMGKSAIEQERFSIYVKVYHRKARMQTVLEFLGQMVEEVESDVKTWLQINDDLEQNFDGQTIRHSNDHIARTVKNLEAEYKKLQDTIAAEISKRGRRVTIDERTAVQQDYAMATRTLQYETAGLTDIIEEKHIASVEIQDRIRAIEEVPGSGNIRDRAVSEAMAEIQQVDRDLKREIAAIREEIDQKRNRSDTGRTIEKLDREWITEDPPESLLDAEMERTEEREKRRRLVRYANDVEKALASALIEAKKEQKKLMTNEAKLRKQGIKPEGLTAPQLRTIKEDKQWLIGRNMKKETARSLYEALTGRVVDVDGQEEDYVEDLRHILSQL